jgi:hypothetical protein
MLQAQFLASEETVNPLLPAIPDLVWSAVVFVIILIFFWFRVLPNVKALLDKRSAAIEGNIEKAAIAQQEAEAALASYTAQLAAARADAAGDVKFEQESPWAENLTLVGFVPEDEDVIKAADKLLGVTGTRIADQKSLEPTDTYKTSAVANIKKNQYGI